VTAIEYKVKYSSVQAYVPTTPAVFLQNEKSCCTKPTLASVLFHSYWICQLAQPHLQWPFSWSGPHRGIQLVCCSCYKTIVAFLV